MRARGRTSARARAAVAALALPAAALAQVDPSLIVPTGNVVSMFFVLASAFVVRARLSSRALAIGLGVAAAFATALVPTAWLAAWPRLAFLVGFVPPLAVAAVVLRLRR